MKSSSGKKRQVVPDKVRLGSGKLNKSANALIKRNKELEKIAKELNK